MSGNSIVIRVGGAEYAIRSEDGVEHMQQVAALCDEKLQSVDAAYPQYGLARRYTLAMLELADQYVKLKNEYDALKKEIDNLTTGEWK